MDRPEIILAPGPTPIPPEVLLAQGSPLVYHRGPGFGKLMREVTAHLKELYRTSTADVLLMTSSGTGGLESAIQNCFSPGDEVFVPLAGFFADRWKRLAEAYGSADEGPLEDGSLYLAEVHWYQATGIGRKELKIKQLIEERQYGPNERTLGGMPS